MKRLKDILSTPSSQSTARGEPTCKECLDRGWRRDATGYEVDCSCETGTLRTAERGRFWEAALWSLAKVPSRFGSYTLDGSPCESAIVDRLRFPSLLLRDYQWKTEAIPWFGSWFFWGDSGIGKTGLAVGYLWEWIRAGLGGFRENEHPLFITVPDFLSELRDTYNAEGGSERAVLSTYRTPALLILDDLGAEHVKDTGWLEDRLYQLIGYRHAELKQTIFTSNLPPDGLGARIGERITWRIVEMCGDRIIHVQGPNLRA